MDKDLAPKAATEATKAVNAAAAESLPLSDRRDYEDSVRGFIGTLSEPITRADGATVLTVDSHDEMLTADTPDTVHPSLWRHAQVSRPHGLFEVVDRVYQVRGLDLSNMTIIEGDTGILIIDPLVYNETATAALALYRKHRGDREVKAVIYTHSHLDHYGGSRAVTTQAEVDAGSVTVIAPAGFLEEAVSENVYAGNAMSRRALYQTANIVAPGERGQVNSGLGNVAGHAGLNTLIAPTDIVTATGQTRTVDGVEMEFQLALGTEAPSEFLIYFPQFRALCTAEDATHTMHQLYTLRGAQIRDAVAWWKALDEAIALYGDRTDLLFAQHTWPTWGTAEVTQLLADQRDVYKYIHDEVLRMANCGMTSEEIAEDIELPPALQAQWYTHGYYGSLSHNAKAVYQRYLGWYDSHPAHLHRLPPADVAPRYVKAMGGRDTALKTALEAFDEGDYRWAAELLTHLVFADPEDRDAALLQADTFEQLGYQAENGLWRNEYLTAALELRHGVHDLGTVNLAGEDVLAAMTPDMLFDLAGIKLNGPKAWDLRFSVNWTISDDNNSERFAVQIRNGVLIYTPELDLPNPDLVITSTKDALTQLVLGASTVSDLASAGEVTLHSGDLNVLTSVFNLVEPFPFWFNIVTP
ncbi:alkyl sulfatase dimerization domain-containing protein [Rhodococcus erythropolis]|uniref:alkyl/aryl-sulfatase n=1 Tax=Rhodococcus erythropolis TaxID=1833 RepID=UPI002949FFD2|nr:alkyl sulfatase dimerization domain-containing protein [Rhodococcus erythropolis]MDV6211934.1 alkyl sulfatase dimerization domain-containing protein [Rhodococcus erythropolis]